MSSYLVHAEVTEAGSKHRVKCFCYSININPLKLGGLPQKSLSFTPGFSLVLVQGHYSETVLTVSAGKGGKPLKRFSAFRVTLSHQAKAWCE